MPELRGNAFGGSFRREYRLKKETLAYKERENLSPLSLPTTSTSVSLLSRFFFYCFYKRSRRPRPESPSFLCCSTGSRLASISPGSSGSLLSLPARNPHHSKNFQPRAHPSFPSCFSRSSLLRQAFQAQCPPEIWGDVADSPRARLSAWDCFKRFPSVSSVLILLREAKHRTILPWHGRAPGTLTHDKRGA